ncbi:hypothetical protein ZWY2020_033964 [Hordeum vulgare]|nr:hypothetical protein ZWY2020_033964 [Hordeum vulgare]
MKSPWKTLLTPHRVRVPVPPPLRSSTSYCLAPLFPRPPGTATLDDLLQAVLHRLPPANVAWASCFCRLCRAGVSDRAVLEAAFQACWGVRRDNKVNQRRMGNSKRKAIEGDNVSDVSTGMVNSNSKATEDDKVSYVATGDFIDQGMHADDDDADQINIDVANVDEYNANGIAVDDNDDNEYSTGPGVGNSKSKATEDDIVSDVAADIHEASLMTLDKTRAYVNNIVMARNNGL